MPFDDKELINEDIPTRRGGPLTTRKNLTFQLEKQSGGGGVFSDKEMVVKEITHDNARQMWVQFFHTKVPRTGIITTCLCACVLDLRIFSRIMEKCVLGF